MPTEVATAWAPCSRVDRASRSDPPAIAVAEADPGPSKASRDGLERLVESGHQGRPPRTFTRSEVRSVGGISENKKETRNSACRDPKYFKSFVQQEGGEGAARLAVGSGP